MQKCIVISALLFIVLSCKNSNKNPPVNAGTVTDTTLNQDTVRNSGPIKKDSVSDSGSTKKSFPESKNIVMVEDKMKNKAILNEVDYGIIGKFLTQNRDESLSEEIGYYLFEYFQGNEPANGGYLSFLNKKGNAYKEKILGKLIDIMCIDLNDDKYTYDKLTTDFSVFKGSNAAQMALKKCVDNHVD